MRRPPRPPKERAITRSEGLRILWHGSLNAAAGAPAFYAVYRGRGENLAEARTFAFVTVALTQLFFSFGCRSFRYTLPELGLFSNPWLSAAIIASILLQIAAVTIPFARPIFDVVPVAATWEWGLVALLALTPVTVIEVTKLVRARVGRNGEGVGTAPEGWSAS
jgi:Ca2+-transporting ATPase